MHRHDEDPPTCEEAVRHMYEYIDQELPAAERSSVQEHLDDCPPCISAFSFEQELKTVIAARCREDVPDELYVKVRQSLKIEVERYATGEHA